MSGFATLLYKEVLRFWKVSFQTVAAPVLSALLFLLVFSHALAGHVEAYPGVAYAQFLVPGLAMMSMLQNAFANSSSSLIQSKITGNIVFILLAPISYLEFFWAYVAASVARGLAVGACVLAVTAWFVELRLEAPLWTAAFALLGAALAGALGKCNCVLMRGHGMTVIGASVQEVVFRSIYTEMNARLQIQATQLEGPIEFLSDEEGKRSTISNAGTIERPWEVWKKSALRR